MRKLDVSAISTTNAMPVKSGMLEHLQFAYQECIAELGKGLFGSQYDPTKVYIINGLINSGSGANYNISAGSVLYAGEIYLVDAAVFTISGSNVARAIISTTFYSGTQADSVTFTDGVNRNIHQIRKVTIGAGLAGSGIADFSNFIDLKYKPQGGIGQTIEWTIPGGALTDYFNITSGAGIHPLTLGWIIDPAGGTFIVGYKNGDAAFGAIGNTGGAKTKVLTMDNLPSDGVKIQGVSGNSYTSGGSVSAILAIGHGITPTGDQTTADSFTYDLGLDAPFSILPPYTVRLKITRVS